jgi:hypothetical protein
MLRLGAIVQRVHTNVATGTFFSRCRWNRTKNQWEYAKGNTVRGPSEKIRKVEQLLTGCRGQGGEGNKEDEEVGRLTHLELKQGTS